MATERPDPHEEMHQEADRLTGGPGVVATKSQAQGGIGGTFLGGFVGALIGVIVGAVFFGGAIGTIISVVVCAFAGATAGGMIGGSVRPRQKAPGGRADT